MCIPPDSMLWALVARIRDDGYVATESDMRALLGSRCPRERVREVLEQAARNHPQRPFAAAIEALGRVSEPRALSAG